jgi:CysZ protein
VLHGVGFIVRTPRAWSYAVVPVLLAILLTGVLASLAIWQVPGWVGAWIGPTASTWTTVGAVVAQVLATVAAVVLSALVGFALAQPLAGPALEQIVRLQDAELGMPARAPTPFFQDVVRSTGSLAVSYVFGLPIIALLFVLGIVVPFAMIITKPLELLVAALTLAWDLIDYPLSVRGLSVRARLGFVRRNLGAVVGFGAGLALVGLVPCLLFLLLPAGVAGAGRLTVEIERWEQSRA